MGDGRRYDLLFLVFIQRVELAIRPQDEDAMHSAGEEPIQEPAKTRQIEVFVGLHRSSHGRDDSTDLHNELRRNRET